jgi:transcription antitermination factor NusG
VADSISTPREGERVRIIDGAFAGMTGTIVSPDEALALVPGCVINSEVVEKGGRYWVLLSIFGRDLPVELRADQLSVIQ